MKETAVFENVSPKRAQEFLALSAHNRKTRKWWVEALAAAMKRNEWITTHQGFAFNEQGEFLDGHHRAMAIVKAGVTVRALVVRGINGDAFRVTDIGIKRTIADTTGLDKPTSEVTRLAGAFLHGAAVSSQQVQAVADSGLAEVHGRLHLHCSSTRKFFSSTGMRLAACILVMDGEPEAYVFETYRNLVLQHFMSLPPVCHSLIKQSTSGVAKTSEPAEMLARGMKAFSPQYASNQKLVCHPEDVRNARDRVREVIKRAIPI